MRAIEQEAMKNKIAAYSLDMHTSRMWGQCWSFGVTFVDNRINWPATMEKYMNTENYAKYHDVIDPYRLNNLDNFFTFLREVSEFKIGVFYIEKLRFIHYSDNFINKASNSGVYYWHDGILELPVLSEVIGLEGDRGRFLIDGHYVDKIDIGLSEEEGKKELQKYAYYGVYEGDLEQLKKPDNNIGVYKIALDIAREG